MNHIERNFVIGSVVVGFILIVSSIIATLNAPAPKPKYTGDVTVISKKVEGYACSVRYTQTDGTEDGTWLGKPGAAICNPINLGPAKMVDGNFIKETLRD